MRRHLRDGALAGMAGGAALALVLLLAGEGAIDRAIKLEQRAHPGTGGDEMFGRGAQQAGGALASVLYGLALGAILAVAFVALRRLLATRSEWRAAVQLAAIGFVTVNLVPFLKYPGNPPGVGDAATIGRRTTLYLLMLAWSALATVAAWRVARTLLRRGLLEHVRLPAVVALYVVVVVVGLTALPGSPERVTVPATLLWRFRLASLAGTATFWAVTGTVLGWLRLAATGTSPFAGLRRVRAPASGPA